MAVIGRPDGWGSGRLRVKVGSCRVGFRTLELNL
jgi:hypothetical protein